MATIPPLPHALDRQHDLALRAAGLLRHAADAIEVQAVGEHDLTSRAIRLRGAAALAHNAALDVAAASGAFELAATNDGA